MKKLLVFALSVTALFVINSCASTCCSKQMCTSKNSVSDTVPQAKTVANTQIQNENVLIGSDAGQAGALRTVYFGTNQDTLTENTKTTLRHNAEWLKKNPTVKIKAEGCYDHRGTLDKNIPLSQRRAENVKKYLVAQGVTPERITTASVGRELPTDPIKTKASLAKNRRVNFVLIN